MKPDKTRKKAATATDSRQCDRVDELEFHTQPNDAYFKAVFSDLQIARPFFKNRLPPELSIQMDWSTLTLKPGSYVKRSLQQSQSDLLFSVQMGGAACVALLAF